MEPSALTRSRLEVEFARAQEVISTQRQREFHRAWPSPRKWWQHRLAEEAFSQLTTALAEKARALRERERALVNALLAPNADMNDILHSFHPDTHKSVLLAAIERIDTQGRSFEADPGRHFAELQALKHKRDLISRKCEQFNRVHEGYEPFIRVQDREKTPHIFFDAVFHATDRKLNPHAMHETDKHLHALLITGFNGVENACGRLVATLSRDAEQRKQTVRRLMDALTNREELFLGQIRASLRVGLRSDTWQAAQHLRRQYNQARYVRDCLALAVPDDVDDSDLGSLSATRLPGLQAMMDLDEQIRAFNPGWRGK